MSIKRFPVPYNYVLVTDKPNWKPIPEAIILTPMGWVKPLTATVHHTHDGPIAVPTTEGILAEAQRITSVDRQYDYGDAKTSFQRIASFWSTYLNTIISPTDVAQMMSLLKISRSKTSPKRDTFVDQAVYARCAAICSSME